MKCLLLSPPQTAPWESCKKQTALIPDHNNSRTLLRRLLFPSADDTCIGIFPADPYAVSLKPVRASSALLSRVIPVNGIFVRFCLVRFLYRLFAQRDTASFFTALSDLILGASATSFFSAERSFSTESFSAFLSAVFSLFLASNFSASSNTFSSES